MHFQIRASVVAALLLTAAPATSHAQSSCLDVIDFEDHLEGAIVSTVTGAAGAGPVGVRATNPLMGAGINAAIVFDSACIGGCSGGDADLGTPNADFGGPGSGIGGALGAPGESSIALGNHLIVAEDLVDVDRNGLVDDPDDQGDQPVSILLDFSALGDVILHELTVVDIDANRAAGSISLRDAAGATLTTVPAPITGNNGTAIVDLRSTPGVRTVSIDLGQSAAIDNVVFAISCDDGDPCTIDQCAGDTCVNIPIQGCVSCSDALDCDDGNPCTDDVCGLDRICVNPPNSATCDDGIFCNGPDTCAGGDCSVHAGDPCAGGAECADTCDELRASCFELAGTACTDDGNVCTDSTCDGAGSCVAENNAVACDDGVFCNGDDMCMDGTCSAHTGNPCPAGTLCNEQDATCDVMDCTQPDDDPACDDGNDCTTDSCDVSTGTCVNENNMAPCDDGLFCNGADMCMDGTCSAHAGDPCTSGTECADQCDEEGDTCFSPAGTACTDDGNVCTDSICDGAGSCVAENNAVACDDGVFCNGDDMCMDGTCSAHTGNPCPAGTLCNEQDATCVVMDCTQPDDPACDDGNDCTTDSCDLSTGLCLHENNMAPCDDGLFCNGADMCMDGTCSAHAGDPCTSGTECADQCDEEGDTCFSPAGTDCTSDGNVCTDNICDGVGTCMAENNAADCDDGVFCNGADTCLNGECSLHAGDPCTGGTECADSCDEAAGSCSSPAGTGCTSDGNVCTDNICDGSGTCTAVPNASPCDDGDVCTGQDTCADGACLPGGEPCPPGSVCNEDTAMCDVLQCTTPDDPACDDGNPCTDDSCMVESGVCQNAPNVVTCDDGVFCNGVDSCAEGSCSVHAGDPCDGGAECNTTCNEDAGNCATPAGTECSGDGNECTDDVCDGAGACSHPPSSGACDDGVFCNGADSCADGSCSVHTGDPCVGGTECADSCNEVEQHCLAPGGAACGSDANECTDDVCDGAGTCIHPDNMAPCDDGVFCNGDDMCMGGSCSAHSGDPCAGGGECAESCDESGETCFDPQGTACSSDGNECTDDVCDGAGTCAHPGNMAPCDDGVFCNGDDMCMDGSCSAHAGDPCPDGETCDEETSMCVAPGCGSAPRLVISDVTCVVNSECSATVVLDSGAAGVASAVGTLTSTGTFTCGMACEAGSAAPSGTCFMNPNNCRFIVADSAPPIVAFEDGPIAIVPFTCNEAGEFALSLAEISLGDTLGGVVSGPCVAPGVLTCTDGQGSVCNGPGEDGSCDDGLFCNGVESCAESGCAAGAPPCTGECDEDLDQCVVTPSCVDITLGAGVGCEAGGDCSVPLFIDTGGLAVTAVGATIDAGPGLGCSSCASGSAAPDASCFVGRGACDIQVTALSDPPALFDDGILAEVAVSCAAPTSGEICVADVVLAGPLGRADLQACSESCVPYACTPANQLCAEAGDCEDGVDCTVDCCSFDPDTSTLECAHEDNECSGCADGPRLAGVDTLCTIGRSCDVAIQVESGIDPIASISGTLEASTGLTLEALSLGACTSRSEVSSLDSLPQFSMSAPPGTAYCDGDAVIAQVRCEEAGVKPLTPATITLGDDRLPLPIPICGGCGAAASVVCVEPDLLILCGDATFEGRLTSTDSLVVLRHSIGFDDPCPMSVCDVDGSGRITANDAMELLFGVVGVSTLTCGDHPSTVASGYVTPVSSTTSTTEAP